MLDGSVGGGREGAMTSDLTMLLGGEYQVVDRVRPVLDSMVNPVPPFPQIWVSHGDSVDL